MGAQTPAVAVGGAVLQLRGCCMGLQGQGLRVVLCSNNLSGRKAWCSLGSLSGEIQQCEPLVAPQRAQDLMRPQGSAELSTFGVWSMNESLYGPPDYLSQVNGLSSALGHT